MFYEGYPEVFARHDQVRYGWVLGAAARRGVTGTSFKGVRGLWEQRL